MYLGEYSNSINLLINQDSCYSTPKSATSPKFLISNIQKSADQIIHDYNELTILKTAEKSGMNESFSQVSASIDIERDDYTINRHKRRHEIHDNKVPVAQTFSILREKFERFSRAEKVGV